MRLTAFPFLRFESRPLALLVEKRSAEVVDTQWGRAERPVNAGNIPCFGVGSRADQAGADGAFEMRGDPVVHGHAGLDAARLLEAFVGRAAIRFAIVVRRATTLEPSETIELAEIAARIGVAFFKPADGTSAYAAEHDALFPGAAHHVRHSGGVPNREHITGVAAAHVDDVTVEQARFHVRGLAKKRKVARATIVAIERGVELGDQSIGVAAGGGHERDPRGGRAAGVEHVLVEEWIVGLH